MLPRVPDEGAFNQELLPLGAKCILEEYVS